MSDRSRIRTSVSAALGLGVVAVTVFATRHRLAGAGREFEHIRWYWLAVALGAELGSMSAFARMQRSLLAAGGLDVPASSALAVTYAANAVAMTLPVAGSATGTAFAFRRWVQRGADPAVATWSLLMAGIFSGSALAIVGGVGGLMADNLATGILGAISTLLGIAPFIVVLIAVRRPHGRRRVIAVAAAVVHRARLARGRPAESAAADVERFFDRLATVRLGSRDGWAAAGFGLMNWVADIGCLAACVAAFGASIPWSHLVLLYMAGIGAAAFSFTPAGIGVVEVVVAAAATSVGIAKGDAIASALLYRGVSSWLVIAAGWIVFAVLRRRTHRQSGTPEVQPVAIQETAIVLPAPLMAAPTPTTTVIAADLADSCC